MDGAEGGRAEHDADAEEDDGEEGFQDDVCGEGVECLGGGRGVACACGCAGRGVVGEEVLVGGVYTIRRFAVSDEVGCERGRETYACVSSIRPTVFREVDRSPIVHCWAVCWRLVEVLVMICEARCSELWPIHLQDLCQAFTDWVRE